MSKLVVVTLFFTVTGITTAMAGAIAAPEIDPASALTAVTLLLGGITVMKGRKS